MPGLGKGGKRPGTAVGLAGHASPAETPALTCVNTGAGRSDRNEGPCATTSGINVSVAIRRFFAADGEKRIMVVLVRDGESVHAKGNAGGVPVL